MENTDAGKEAYADVLNIKLNTLYTDKVLIDRYEGKKYRDFTASNVGKILEYINTKDGRFSREPVRAGSYWQGLKVEKADEYDYGIVLKDIHDCGWSNEASRLYPQYKYYGFNYSISDGLNTIPDQLDIVPYSCLTLNGKPAYRFPQYAPFGYCFMSVGNALKWPQRHDLIRDNDIVPFLVHKKLKELLTDARRDLSLIGDVHQFRNMNRPAITLRFRSEDREAYIDFAPLIRTHSPFKPWIGWPRGARWPSRKKVEAVKKVGINLVAKTDFWWMYSFVEAEKKLVSEVDSDGGKRKETHRLVKLINRDLWSPTTETKPAITSYILKNVWFWEMENHPDSSDWDASKVATRVLSMTERVVRGIQRRPEPNIEQFFQPRFNLLASKDRQVLAKTLQRIQEFQSAPLGAILKLLQE